MVEARGHGANLLAQLDMPRKIAVMRASRVGDFICAMPALRALRFAAPQAEIVMITLPVLAELATRSPYCDRFAPFPGFPGIAQQFFQAKTTLAFLQQMQNERFDLAIQLQGSGVYANPFTLLLGANATAGFVRAEDDPSALDAALVWPERGHETGRLLALMRHIGVETRGEGLAFPLRTEDWRTAGALIEALPRPLIGVHAGSHDPRRRWPLDRFAAVIRALLRRHQGTVILLGGTHEAPQNLALADAVGAGTRDLAGRTGLAALGAVIAQLNLLVSNDTGPAHIGYALGTPTVTIYRSGGAERYGPPAHGPFAALEPAERESPETALVTVPQVLAAADRLLSPVESRLTEILSCPPTGDSTVYAR